MIKSGVIKRSDQGMFIRLDDVHIRPDFNARVDSERLNDNNESLFNFLMGGGRVPPLEVIAREDGGVWVVEGHRRTQQYRRVRDAGAPVEWIAIIQFQGSDVDQVARIMNSNNQLSLTQFEQAVVVKRLAAFNLTPAEIATHVNKSVVTVNMLLTVANANHDVQELVKTGAVSLDVAAERVSQAGASAGAILAQEKEKALAAGKKRLTRSVTSPRFTSKQSRSLAEMLAGAAVSEDGRSIILSGPFADDVVAIIKGYAS
nr:chromosome partitioning protein ParB [Dickeya fangzhongdai]